MGLSDVSPYCRAYADGFGLSVLFSLPSDETISDRHIRAIIGWKDNSRSILDSSGDIDPIPLQFRTSHPKSNTLTGFKEPISSRKQVRFKRDKKSITTADIAGDAMFRNLWVDDMFGRKAELVIYMVDHRALTSPQFAMDSSAGLTYLVDNIIKKDISSNISKSKEEFKELRSSIVLSYDQ